jgi:hypothetical protein
MFLIQVKDQFDQTQIMDLNVVTALVYYRGPDFWVDFEIIPIEAVRGQIFREMGSVGGWGGVGAN